MNNKLSCFFLFTLFFPIINYAQDTQIVDSLLAIYENEQSADTSKFKAAKALFNAYLYYDQEQSEHYLSLAYDLAKKMEDENEIAGCVGSRGILFDIAGQLDSSKIYYNKARDIFERTNNRGKLEMVRFNLGLIALKEGNYQEAINLMNQNILPESQVTKENATSQSISHGLLSRVYRIKGYNELSLRNALKAFKIIEITGDESRIADALRDLANAESQLLHFEKSNDYHFQTIALYEKINDKYFLAGSKNDLGSNYLQLKDYPNAVKVLKESLALAKEVGYIDAATAALNNLGKSYMEQGQYELALKHFEEGMAICEENDFPSRLSAIQHFVGELYSKKGAYSKAQELFNKVISAAEEFEGNTLLMDAYYLRAVNFEALGMYQSAVEDYKKFQILNDSIYDAKQITVIEELRIIHDLEQKEKELALFSKNAELDQVKKTRLWISLIAAIGLGGLLLLMQWQRRKKEKELEAERRKVSELENQRLHTELDFKKQELTSKVLQLCRKNEFLQSLNKEVIEFKSEIEGNEKHRLEKLSRKINRDMDVDSDWEQFLKSFETVHPHFNKLLLERYPNLGPNEIRLACLMRMNLESKDIANLLNITPDGVKKARYRMRKKMSKNSSVNLTEYFLNFENVVV